MTSEKLTISLEDFTAYYVKRWKTALITILACMALFAGMTKVTGKEISVPHSEEYLYYEQESKWLEDYLERSALMKLNPSEIYEIPLFLDQISDKEQLRNYTASKELWDQMETDWDKTFLYELLTWQETEEGTVQLLVRQKTEEECMAFAAYVKERLEANDGGLRVTVGKIGVTRDENLQDEQLRWYDRIDYSKSLLLESQAGYTISVNLTAALLTGALTGGILSVVIVLVSFVIRRNKKNVHDRG